METHEKRFEKEKIQKLVQLSTKNKRYSRMIAIVSMVALVTGFTILISNTFKITLQQVEVKDSLNRNKLIIDSLLLTWDNFKSETTKRDSISAFISEFLTVIKIDSTLDKYYSNRVERYYLRKNLRLDQIKQEKKWHIQDNPRSKVTFDKNDILLNIKPDNTSEIYVNALYYPDSLGKPVEIIYQIKLNRDNKVYYIRNLEPQTWK